MQLPNTFHTNRASFGRMRRQQVRLGVFLAICVLLSASPYPLRAPIARATPRLQAQPGSLVRDIRMSGDSNIDNFDLEISYFYTLGNVVYFRQNDGIHGAELWRTDGTSSGTTMVKDIAPGEQSAFPTNMVGMNGTIYFAADNGETGSELWRTDGTPSGTALVKDIVPGLEASYPSSFCVVGNQLFFNIYGGTQAGLWVSNGTAAGTQRIAVNNATTLVASQGKLFFVAETQTSGFELWKSDGTPAGTILVRDINPGTASAFQQYTVNMIDANGRLFFFADDGVNGQELWTSDGTAYGTQLLYDIYGGPGGASPGEMQVYNGAVYFSANNGWNGQELWRSDGTWAGTGVVRDIVADAGDAWPGDLTVAQGLLFFTAYNPANFSYEIWRTDGTYEGTLRLIDPVISGSSTYVSALAATNNALFFLSSTLGQANLWRSDGSPAGTTMVRTGLTFPAGKGDPNFTGLNDLLLFVGSDGATGTELWRSDGTAGGTVVVKDTLVENGSRPLALTAVGGTVFFSADDGVHGRELWRSDATAASTVLVKDIRGGLDSGLGQWDSPPVVLNNVLYFVANDGVHGSELWRSDGTPTGTYLLKDIADGNSSAAPNGLTVLSGKLYFAALDSNGHELWQSDGTPEGTVRVRDINLGSGDGISSDTFPSVQLNGLLYFAANDGLSGTELWHSDGTAENTVPVKDIVPGSDGSYPSNLVVLNNTLYFVANNALWKSDGTPTNTVQIRTIMPQSLVAADNLLYFVADDGVRGQELWRSDGTTNGTTMVKDIAAGELDAFPGYEAKLINVNGTLFFVASDGVHGREIWKSDGTDTGTSLVADVYPGLSGSGPDSLASINGNLLFSATNGINGYQLWKSDSSENGTQVVQLIAPQVGHVAPAHITIAGDTIFFTADDGISGQELWAMPLHAIAPPAGEITTASPFYRLNQEMFFAATIRSNGQPLSGSTAVSVKIGAQAYRMYDDGSNGDAAATDGIYSRWIQLTDSVLTAATLLVGTQSLGTVTVTPMQQPRLLALIDITAMYQEFRDTSMAPQEDIDANQTHDFYDLVKRIRLYAGQHEGIVLDLPHAITTANNFPAAYTSAMYDQGSVERRQQGFLIDQLIAQARNWSPNRLENIAIIGDDQVVPFYRVYDPINAHDHYDQGHTVISEDRKYPSDNGGARGNASLEDMEQGYILSDVPYSVSAYQEIKETTWNDARNLQVGILSRPQPDFGIGRVFSDRPATLIQAIDRYETPILLTPQVAKAAIFSGLEPDNPTGLAERLKRNLVPKIQPLFNPHFTEHHALTENWSPQLFADTAADVDFFSLWGHATHMSLSIRSNSTLRASDLASVQITKPTLFVGFGCNLGLTVSDYPDGAGITIPYNAALINQFVKRGVTVFAPTSHAYMYGSESFTDPNLNEKLIDLFINYATDSTQSTIGQVYRSIFPIYHQQDPTMIGNPNPADVLYHVTSAYGVALYGLPTQPLEHIRNSLQMTTVQHSALALHAMAPAASAFPSSLTIDVPHFALLRQPDGSTLVSIPNETTHLALPNGPALPVIIRSLIIPEHVTVTGIHLGNSRTTVVSEPITLATYELQTSNGDAIDVQPHLSSTYPAELFQYDITPLSKGSLLTLSVSPMVFDATSHKLTLYNQLQLKFDTITSYPDTSLQITAVNVNQDQPVRINLSNQNVDVHIASDHTETMALSWSVRDRNGFVAASGRSAFSVGQGETIASFPLDTTGWAPGPKDLNVYLDRNGEIISSQHLTIMAEGVGLLEMQGVRPFYDTNGEENWKLLLTDETGSPLTGLAQTIKLSIDNTAVEVNPQETAVGNYEIHFDLRKLAHTNHVLRMSATDLRGITGWKLWSVSAKNSANQIFVPFLSR